jgi:alkaline phosphatase D
MTLERCRRGRAAGRYTPGVRSPFRHGVASGDPLDDRVLLWTRVTPPDDRPVDVRFEVSRDAAVRDVVCAGEVSTDGERDWTVHVDASGLEPGTGYHYRFQALGARSPAGRTRTAPAAGNEHLRLAVVSCAKYTAGYFNVYARLAERGDLDFVLHVGDYIYEYGNADSKSPGGRIVRPVQPPHEAVTLADYRARYAHYRADRDVQAVHARHPFVLTLDDHELANDAWRGGAGTHDERRDGRWEERRAAALQAWREWLPVRLPDPADPERIYRSLAFGDLADVIMLDGRTHRDRETKGPEMDAPGRTVLGRTEHRWLLDTLAASRARWRIVGNDVMLGQVFTGFLPEEIGDPLSEVGVLTAREHGPDPDQWDGYTWERDRLLAFLDERPVRDVVFLSGDVHTAWAVDLKRDPRDPDEAPAAVELVTASITTENLDEHLAAEPATASRDVERRVVDENPHVHWVDLDGHGYVLVDVTRERVRGEWFFVAETKRRTAGVRRGPAFEVRAGESRLQPARE